MDHLATPPITDTALSPCIGLQWQLKRNCCLTPTRCLCSCLAAVAFNGAAGAVLLMQGYPVILFFVCLEAVLLLACLLAYAVHACDGETITLHNDKLTVEVQTGGRFRRTVLHAGSVRIDTHASARGLISLSERGFRMELGRHAQASTREAMGRELRQALRHAPTRSPDPSHDVDAGDSVMRCRLWARS